MPIDLDAIIVFNIGKDNVMHLSFGHSEEGIELD
jgi:hypothetical protein